MTVPSVGGSTRGIRPGVLGRRRSSAAPATTASPSPIAPPVAKVSSSPAFGAKALTPAAPIKISVTQGKITELTMTNPTGKVVKGAISSDGASWSLGEVLGYGKTYKVVGSATGTDGKVVPITGSYTTVTPKTKVRTTITPGDGQVVGVAISVIVSFSVKPADGDAIAKNISITTTPKVTGAWVWVQHDGGLWALDFRTKDYWPANTKVHVEANVYGLEVRQRASTAATTSPVTSPSVATRWSRPTSTRTICWSTGTGSRSRPTRPPTARVTLPTRSPGRVSTW